jgi:cysteine desulfurase / selenocysteine lyase
MMDFAALRNQFPLFNPSHADEGTVYLDSAATSLTPLPVLSAMDDYYYRYRANIHRGVYKASATASLKYEEARQNAASFLEAEKSEEIIFTAGTTDSINMVASGWAKTRLAPGKIILVPQGEHHSNLLPWQRAARESGALLQIVPVQKDGGIDYSFLENALSNEVSIVAISALSNVTGEVTDLERVIRAAHLKGAAVLVDAAQGAARIPLSVRELDIDFLALSGHKCYGPTGIGILYGKKELLEELPPFRLGGGMVGRVDTDRAEWAPLPAKLEGGTPDIAGAIGLGAAFRFLMDIGMAAVSSHEEELASCCLEGLHKVPAVSPLHPEGRPHSGLVSFSLKGVHPHDAVTFLAGKGLSLRGGLHCAEPLHRALGLGGTLRASFGMYTRREDIDLLIESLEKAYQFFT